jgi:hypothetical protein
MTDTFFVNDADCSDDLKFWVAVITLNGKISNHIHIREETAKMHAAGVEKSGSGEVKIVTIGPLPGSFNVMPVPWDRLTPGDYWVFWPNEDGSGFAEPVLNYVKYLPEGLVFGSDGEDLMVDAVWAHLIFVPCIKPSVKGVTQSYKQGALLSSELVPGYYWEYVREQGCADSETLPRLVEVTLDDGITSIWVGEDRTAVLGYVFKNAFYLPAERQTLDQIDFESAIARMPERKGFR